MRKLLLCAAACAAIALVGQQSDLFPILKSNVPMGKQGAGLFLVSSNQLLRPWGEQTVIPGRPVDMTFDSERRVLAVLNTRTILLLDGSTGTKVAEIAAHSTSYTGMPHTGLATGNSGPAAETARNGPDAILITPISETGMPAGESVRIALTGHPLPTGIAFSADGNLASHCDEPRQSTCGNRHQNARDYGIVKSTRAWRRSASQ